MKRIAILLLAGVLMTSAAFASELQYEAALRHLLHHEMGMPLEETLESGRGILRTGQEEGLLDTRPRFGQRFTAENGEVWRGWISTETRKLICANVQYADWTLLKNDMRLNPSDPKWEALALEYIEKLRTKGLSDVIQVINDGEILLNKVHGVSFRFILEDGGVYIANIVYALDGVAEVIYRDAVYQQLQNEKW